MNILTINEKKSVIGSKVQLQSLHLDQFSINLDSNKIEFVNKPKYLDLMVKDDLSWDGHIWQQCKSINYYVHVFRRLNNICPKQLLRKVYKSYIQSKLDYGLSLWGCITLGEILAESKEFKSSVLGLFVKIMIISTQWINEDTDQRRDYFLSVAIFKCIHGLAPHYLCNGVTMIANLHNYWRCPVLQHGGPKMKRKVNKDVKPRSICKMMKSCAKQFRASQVIGIPLTRTDLNIMRP